jgi:hypothetical protein
MGRSLAVYTVQMAQWRHCANLGVLMIDTTVKSGRRAFCPEWDMVMGHKDGSVSDLEYMARYKELMDASKKNYPEEWDELLGLGTVALACYCPPGRFCHRHLLKQMVKEECRGRGIEYIDKGEIRKP